MVSTSIDQVPSAVILQPPGLRKGSVGGFEKAFEPHSSYNVPTTNGLQS